jgi:aminoglycoside phosphotransferase (APT) family kinase protein
MIRKIFWDNIGEEPIEINDLTNGMDHYVYQVVFPRRRLVIRFPKRRMYQAKLVPTSWANKKWAKMGVPVPNPLIFSNKFVIETFLDGKPMRYSIIKNPKPVLLETGKLLSKMHKLSLPGYGPPYYSLRGRAKTWDQYVSQWWEKLLMDAKRENVFIPEEMKKIRKVYSLRPRYMGKGKVLHADIIPKHILIKKGKISGIIDASDLMVGDPMYELGLFKLYYKKDEEGKDFNAVLEGYGKHDPKRIAFYSIHVLLHRTIRHKKGRLRRKKRLMKVLVENYLKKCY